jgi:glucose-1-phosphate adenylyltransferase
MLTKYVVEGIIPFHCFFTTLLQGGGHMNGFTGMKGVLALILAGGQGSRLGPLTGHRSKPSVPFGKHLIIDFVMSNCLNSDIRNMMVFTQYRAQELIRHVQHHWPSDRMRESFIDIVPPQQLHGEEWYRGTADAVFQNLSIIDEGDFSDLAILSGDHVYMMDFRQMYAFHKEKYSHFTVCAFPVPTAEAQRFGIIEVDADGRIIGFEEKPQSPKEIPGRPGWSFVSMGNYFAVKSYVRDILHENASKQDTAHDFGKDIIPMILERGDLMSAYDFRENKVPGQEGYYWKDVGTIDSLWSANMDLVAMEPELNLYNAAWPIRTPDDNLPMGKMNSFRLREGKCGQQFAISGGSILEDSYLDHVIVGRNVRVYGSDVTESVIFSDVHIESGCTIHKAIIDEGVIIPYSTSIGLNQEDDRRRGLFVDDSGIVIVPRGWTLQS